SIDLKNGRGLGITVAFNQPSLGCASKPPPCDLDFTAYYPPLTQCAARWAAPVPTGPISTMASGMDEPSLPDSMDELYYVASNDIYVAKRDAQGNWLQGNPVIELDSPENELSPEVSGDGKTIMFVSDRLGVRSVFVATRNDPTSTWSMPTRVALPDALNIDAV